MNKRALNLLAIFLAVALIGGCKSVPDKVKELADNSYFQEASTVIATEQEKLSTNPDLDKIRELERARELFEERVAAHFNEQIAKLDSEGKVRGALKAAEEAFRLCPWSDRIKSTLAVCETRVAVLDKVEAKWSRQISSGEIAPSESREALSDLAGLLSSLSDSPNLLQLQSIAFQGAVAFWAGRLTETKLHLPPSEESQMDVDLRRLLADDTKAKKVEGIVRSVRDLDQTNAPNADNLSLLTAALYADDQNLLFDSRTAVIKRVLQRSFEGWAVNGFEQVLVGASVSFDAVNEAESLFEKVPVLKRDDSFGHALALAHLNRARQLLKGGVSTTLALFHLQRAQLVDSSAVNVGENQALERDARAYLSTVKYPDFTLAIDTNPAISLDIQSIMFSAFSRAFLSHSREDRPWHLVSSGTSDEDVSIVIDSADMPVPDLGKLPRVSSQYLSHYETVPNPFKDSLRWQLDFAKSQVSYAESSYEQAVRSYNWDSSDWNLNRANSAYSDYKSAINNYNMLIDQFNMTPSTVQQPVFLFYTFSQGSIQFGCRISVTCKVGTKEYHFTGESMDKGFARFGTKPTDTNVSTRRDVGVAFDITFDRLLHHLNTALGQVCDQIGPRLLYLKYPSYVPLSDKEALLLQCLMHPWGFDRSSLQQLSLSSWEKESLGLVSVAQLQLSLPKIELTAGKTKTTKSLSAEAAAKSLEPFVCQIKSIKDGEAISSGSGAVIGSNGLILTCAHVLNSPDIEIDFSAGKYRGTYQGDVVFVNEKCDVAVLRAKKLANSEWASVRLNTSTNKGERIIAIGNPAIDQATINLGGVSIGVVSNPKVAAFGQDELVADITVASGSSGGPLFSLENGELVGIVLAVTRPGLNVEGVSSSGSYCLAAPADMLGKWLGLQYKQ